MNWTTDVFDKRKKSYHINHFEFYKKFTILWAVKLEYVEERESTGWKNNWLNVFSSVQMIPKEHSQLKVENKFDGLNNAICLLTGNQKGVEHRQKSYVKHWQKNFIDSVKIWTWCLWIWKTKAVKISVNHTHFALKQQNVFGKMWKRENVCYVFSWF